MDVAKGHGAHGSRPDFHTDVAIGQRFEFGKNWQRFLSVLDEDRIEEAARSLQEMLGEGSITGRTFLDVGSGSGLFSLAAMRLGASRVHSFDFDPQSVACTQELKRRYLPGAAEWTIAPGDVLDAHKLEELGTWDIVYSWGVLHHTGDMWRALANVSRLVMPGGTLFISIYNDQGGASKRWGVIKRTYNKGGLERRLISSVFITYSVVRGAAIDVLRHKNPVRRYLDYRMSRGMSRLHDWYDWLGGYPFEVAKPEQIFSFYQERGFTLDRLKTRCTGWGCNEFVFRKS